MTHFAIAVLSAIYLACVDFMLAAANLFHVTYRDANAFMFFILWPVVTVLLLLAVAIKFGLRQWRKRSVAEKLLEKR